MEHSFDIELAKEVGIEGAIIYKNIEFWIAKNKANGHNFIDGHYWTYNSWSAWQELFPYMKKNTINTALKKLKEAGYITWKNGLNKENKWDKTNYYRLVKAYNTDTLKSNISTNDKVSDEYYTDIKTSDNKQDNNIITEIISHLNQVSGKNYKATSTATKRLINARLKEGFTLEDFKRVHINKLGWLKDDKMKEYYRPATLYGTKFEGYLNEQTKSNTPSTSKTLGYTI